MMPPPRIAWPPKTFTPSRWAFESRPFLEEPRPFLCAISNCLVCRPAQAASRLKSALECLAVDEYLVDADLDVVLAVALHLLVLLLALEFEDQDLLAAALCDDGCGHLGAGEVLLELALAA